MSEHQWSEESLRMKVGELSGVALRAEVERLKAEVVKVKQSRWDIGERLKAAESRLAAIRERAKDGTRMRREYLAAYDKDPNWQPYQAAVAACLQVALWVLDGDAPNSSMLSKGSGEATNAALLDPMGDGPICVCAKGWKPCVAPRHPCSSTCTHDDAANPGHPELVKAQSVAVARAALGLDAKCYSPKHINCPCGWDPPQTCHYPTPDGEPSWAACKESHELQQAYDRGAEAMRAACWSALEPVLRANLGACPGDPVYDEAKAAIAGAVP